MQISNLNWMQLEAYLTRDNRCILPLGSTEQHAYISLSTDSILANKLAREVGDLANVVSFPCVEYGMTPYFSEYPGSISLRPNTYFLLIEDILNNLYQQGFRRILIINGHGGNSPVMAMIHEWQSRCEDAQVIFHNWWAAPKVWAQVQSIDPVASHASWMENFPWTRIEGVTVPDQQKPMVNLSQLRQLSSKKVKTIVGDGNYGGAYVKSDAEMMRIWDVGLAETLDLLNHGWVEDK